MVNTMPASAMASSPAPVMKGGKMMAGSAMGPAMGPAMKGGKSTRKNRGSSKKGKSAKKGRGTPWTKFVKKIYDEMKRKDKNAKLGDAMKMASKRKNEM